MKGRSSFTEVTGNWCSAPLLALRIHETYKLFGLLPKKLIFKG